MPNLPGQLGMWSLCFDTTAVDLDSVRQILDLRFTGYNIQERTMGNGPQHGHLLWYVSCLCDEQGIENLAREIRAKLSPQGLIQCFLPEQGSALGLVTDAGYVDLSKQVSLYTIMTEDMNRRGIINLLAQRFDRFFLRETEGVWRGTKESSLSIDVFSADRISVVKAAAEVGTMNRQETMGIVKDGETEFIKTWHEHTVGGKSV